MSGKRVAQDYLAHAIKNNDFTMAILPTGYGKTTFFKHNPNLITTKTIHVLPLQAIVQQFYQEMKYVLGDHVGYQMSLQISEEDKRPYLSRKYMISTIDSYVLDFYGIPVHEILRSKWHSDLALLFARTSNLILDEFHLMATVDSENAEEEFAKVIGIFNHIINSLSDLGLKTVILTATLSPSLILKLINSEYLKKEIIILAPENHKFVNWLKNKGAPIAAVWDSQKDSFVSGFSNYTKRVKTMITFTDSQQWIKDVTKIINSHRGSKILVILNHTKRVVELGNELHDECVFIHGLFGNKSKTRFVQNLNQKKYDCVIATQVIEAGVDIDFDVLITDVAPAYSLIQRAGRVLRSPDRSDEAEIYILRYDSENELEKQISWVYSKELTLKTLESLQKHKANGIVNINWRLAEPGDTYDYLKLLLDVDSVVNEIIDKSKDSLQNTLNFLSNVINSPYETMVTIDEKFKGSFIRSASLVPLVIKTYDKEVKEEIVTVSWDRFINFINKLDKIKFLYTVIRKDEDEEGEITVDKDMIDVNRPLTSLIKIMRKARRKEKVGDDFMSGYIKIVGKGFKVGSNLIRYYKDKYNNKYHYVDISSISGA